MSLNVCFFPGWVCSPGIGRAILSMPLSPHTRQVGAGAREQVERPTPIPESAETWQSPSWKSVSSHLEERMCFQVRREALLSTSVLSLPTFGKCHLPSESRSPLPVASHHQVLATLPNCNPSQPISFLLTLAKPPSFFAWMTKVTSHWSLTSLVHLHANLHSMD